MKYATRLVNRWIMPDHVVVLGSRWLLYLILDTSLINCVIRLIGWNPLYRMQYMVRSKALLIKYVVCVLILYNRTSSVKYVDLACGVYVFDCS
jgi:hypothetical protein